MLPPVILIQSQVVQVSSIVLSDWNISLKKLICCLVVLQLSIKPILQLNGAMPTPALLVVIFLRRFGKPISFLRINEIWNKGLQDVFRKEQAEALISFLQNIQ